MRKINCALIVDDDPINNFITYRILRKWGLCQNIILLSNGQEALKYLRQFYADFHHYPELILLDIHMPVMDGFEFLENFNAGDKKTDEVKIIVLTTGNRIRDIERIRNLGASEILIKPLEEEKLKSLLA